MNTNENTIQDILVYAPRAVVYGAAHANEGGGGLVLSAAEAIALGATNIRPAKDGSDHVADWPQHYWEA